MGPIERAEIPVLGDSRVFPVGRIWCVGRNFADHAREMGHDPDRDPPFFFAKPADAVVAGDRDLRFPSATENLHHEVELAVAIGSHGQDIEVSEARRLVFGYAVALDMTRRDLQDEAKRLSRPWAMAKGFDQSCPISAIRPAIDGHLISEGNIELRVNEALRQSGDLNQLIWSIDECLSILSQYVALRPGDLLLTGTPAGVGPVQPGDHLQAQIENVGALTVHYEKNANSDCGQQEQT
ncbi:MAG: fumarylacetoacetate hydrolase family protein [Pseudomonadota bacterium]